MKKPKLNYKKIYILILIINLIFVLGIIILLFILKINGEDIDYFEKNNRWSMILTIWIPMTITILGGVLTALYSFKKTIGSRHEYRKYLINKLENNESQVTNLLNFDELKLDERKKEDTNKKVKAINSFGDNIIIDEQKKNDDKKDIFALMLKNNDEITDYFKISKSQAKASFWCSVISCLVGMTSLAIGIYGIAILKDVSVSIISIISGSISELISGTIFWVHNKSALQLNHYYDALHENEKVLSAINIADKLSDEKREEVLIEIIHKQIDVKPSKIEAENIKKKKSNTFTRTRRTRNIFLKRQKKD